MQLSGVPQLTTVLLSHLHGDHFDRIARRELGSFSGAGFLGWTRFDGARRGVAGSCQVCSSVA
jgi:hypothetical protein